MMNMPPIDQAMLGIQRGLQGVNKAATQVAAGTLDQTALLEAMISLKAQATVVSASAQVVRTSNDMLGAVLDILA
jgi:hypothetical protein